MNNKSAIRAANRKALPKFLLVLLVAVIIGGVAGFLAAAHDLTALKAALQTAADHLGRHVAPWVLVALAVLIPVLAMPMLGSAKRRLASWDGDDEAFMARIEQNLSRLLWLCSLFMMLAFFFLAAVAQGVFQNMSEAGAMTRIILSLVAFVAIFVELTVVQQQSIDLNKALNPEKKASIYDLRFQKKWLEDSDEAEKIVIGKCAYKAFQATNTACAILDLLTLIAAIAFDIGLVPILAVTTIWIVCQTVYYREAMRLIRPGQKISA